MKSLFFFYNLWESLAAPVSEAKGENLWHHKILKDDTSKIKFYTSAKLKTKGSKHLGSALHLGFYEKNTRKPKQTVSEA